MVKLNAKHNAEMLWPDSASPRDTNRVTVRACSSAQILRQSHPANRCFARGSSLTAVERQFGAGDVKTSQRLALGARTESVPNEAWRFRGIWHKHDDSARRRHN